MGTSNIDAPSHSSGLAWRLRELLQTGSSGEGKRLSFLAIDLVRKHFGPDWPRVSAKVHGVVTATLQSFLTEGDVYYYADELSYIVVSSNRTSGDFDKLMENISTEISSRITGKGIAKDLVGIIHLHTATETGHAGHAAAMETDSAAHLRNIERIMNDADAGSDEFKISDISFETLSSLSTATMSVASQVCVPSILDQDNIRHYGYATLPAESDPLLHAELDALTVEFAAKQIKAAADRHLVFQIPVHRITLSSKKYREMYLKICHGILANRKDRVAFDIHGIDEGTPSNRISEYLQWLRPYARSIVATIDIDFAMVSAFAGLNIASVGADLRSVEGDLAVQQIGKFINRVKAANMKCHVHGVSSKAQADLCLRLGVECLDGELISDGLI